MLGIIYDCFYELCCGGRRSKSKAGIIINHIEDIALVECNELVKYLEIHHQNRKSVLLRN